MFIKENLVPQSWYGRLDDLDDVLNGFFANGGAWSELWVANASLEVLENPKRFEKIYTTTIFGTLKHKISEVKLLMKKDEYDRMCTSIRDMNSDISRNLKLLHSKYLPRIFVGVMDVNDATLGNVKHMVGFCAPFGQLKPSPTPLAFYRLDDIAHPTQGREWVLASPMNDGMFADKKEFIEASFDSSKFSSVPKLRAKPKISNSWRKCFYEKGRPRKEIRLLVVVALEKEFGAFCEIWPGLEKSGHGDYHEEVIVSNGDERYHIFLIKPAEMGSVDAATCAAPAIWQLKPDYVILIGFAGGNRATIKERGNVVYSNSGLAYEYQKWKGNPPPQWLGHPEPIDRSRSFKMGDDLLRWVDRIRKGGDGEWKKQIETRAGRNTLVCAFRGKVASGSKLVATSTFFEKYKDILAVEMEAEGVWKAADSYSKQFMMIKGISDFADEGKNDGDEQHFRELAAKSAALFLRDAVFTGGLKAPRTHR